jgi:hypothetical protein
VSNFTKYFAQNFTNFGLKKLISTSYSKTSKYGKISILTHDLTNDGKIDINDIEWDYMKGDGDFRSEEVKKLRDEADIVITNPPFSLFRDFLAWIFEAKKQFVIIGNLNAITYKAVFPLIKENKLWLGATERGRGMCFSSLSAKNYGKGVYNSDTGLVKFSNTCWYTNIDHGRRPRPLPLMTMSDNLKFSKHKKVKEHGYQKYDNYDAIEVPYTDAIPSDYDGIMGVPISFLDKYSPDQFDIVGMCENEDLYKLKTKVYTTDECKQAYIAKFGKKGTYDLNASGVVIRNGLYETVYQRVLIKHKGK